MSQKDLYKVIFINQDEVFEIYAEGVAESDMFGFMEVEEIVFNSNGGVVVDPSEEKLKTEFTGVKRTYIPIHAIVRIDHVQKQGAAKVSEYKSKGKQSNIHKLPLRPVEPAE